MKKLIKKLSILLVCTVVCVSSFAQNYLQLGFSSDAVVASSAA